jgi:hypothetical protein
VQYTNISSSEADVSTYLIRSPSAGKYPAKQFGVAVNLDRHIQEVLGLKLLKHVISRTED